MKKIAAMLVVLMLLFSCMACGKQIKEDVVDVYIISGQSNALGVSPSADLSIDEKKDYDDVSLFAASNKPYDWEKTILKVKCGYGSTKDTFGLEIGASKALASNGISSNAFIIKYTSDGTAMYNSWTPPKNNDFVLLSNHIDDGLNALKQTGKLYNIKGFIFMQGESDAITEKYADVYQENLEKFILAIREALNMPALQFIIGGINPNNNVLRFRQKVISAQQAVAEKMDNVKFVSTAHLTNLVDLYHYTATNMLQLGQLLMQELLQEQLK